MLYKFLSFRSVTHIADHEHSIKERVVRIKVANEPHEAMAKNPKVGKILQTIDVNIKPYSPPIDATYRF